MEKKYVLVFLVFTTVNFLQASKVDAKWDGKFYEQNSSIQQKSALMSLENISFKGNESVLDVGCGDGKITYRISQKVPQGNVIGFDISKNMIETAQQTYTNVPNLSFHIADATNFILDQKFDYAVSFHVLHWVQDIISALTNIKKALKPGGTLFIKIATMHETCPFYQFFNSLDVNGKWGIAKREKEKTFHAPKTVKEFEEILETVGFTNNNVKLVYDSSCFESFDDVVNWFIAWMPYCIKSSVKESLQLCNELVKGLYEKKSKKLDESFVLTVPMFYAEAH